MSQAEDVASIYYANDMGGSAGDDVDALNDLFNYLSPNEAGPPQLRVGKCKDINRYKEIMREGAEVSDKESSEKDHNDEGEDEEHEDDEALSVSPLHYAMELPHNAQRFTKMNST